MESVCLSHTQENITYTKTKSQIQGFTVTQNIRIYSYLNYIELAYNYPIYIISNCPPQARAYKSYASSLLHICTDLRTAHWISEDVCQLITREGLNQPWVSQEGRQSIEHGCMGKMTAMRPKTYETSIDRLLGESGNCHC